MDFVDYPDFNTTCDDASHKTNVCCNSVDKKKHDEMCEKLLKSMTNDETLKKKYERECGPKITPDIIWMA